MHHPISILSKSTKFNQYKITLNKIKLINKGLQYNLHFKKKYWTETLALEAETAISHLSITD
jgi:hypothetical protein